MSKKLFLLFLFLLFIPIALSRTSLNPLTKAYADTLYCQQNGSCHLANLTVTNYINLTDLTVNRTDYWDNLDTPMDIREMDIVNIQNLTINDTLRAYFINKKGMDIYVQNSQSAVLATGINIYLNNSGTYSQIHGIHAVANASGGGFTSSVGGYFKGAGTLGSLGIYADVEDPSSQTAVYANGKIYSQYDIYANYNITTEEDFISWKDSHVGKNLYVDNESTFTGKTRHYDINYYNNTLEPSIQIYTDNPSPIAQPSIYAYNTRNTGVGDSYGIELVANATTLVQYGTMGGLFVKAEAPQNSYCRALYAWDACNGGANSYAGWFDGNIGVNGVAKLDNITSLYNSKVFVKGILENDNDIKAGDDIFLTDDNYIGIEGGERLVFDDNGNEIEVTDADLGINVASPDGRLHVSDADFPVGKFTRTTTASSGNIETTSGIASGYLLETETSANNFQGFGGGIILSGDTANSAENYLARLYARQDTASNKGMLQFWTGTTGATLAMTIRDDQDVGIGTAYPTHKLHVVGDVNVTGTIYYGGLSAQSPHVLHENKATGRTDICIVADNGDIVLQYLHYNGKSYEWAFEKDSPLCLNKETIKDIVREVECEPDDIENEVYNPDNCRVVSETVIKEKAFKTGELVNE